MPDAHLYSRAKLFSKVGKRTPIVARFSTSSSRAGAPPATHNEAFGLAVRFKTGEGNWDLLSVNFPQSAAPYPMKTPDSTHRADENPTNNLPDANVGMDYLVSNQEALQTRLWQFSDISIPNDWRMMTTFTGCSLSLINDRGKTYHVRFTVKAKRKHRYMDAEVAKYLRSNIPDYYFRDLYTSIERGDFPEWNLIAQILTPEVMKKIDFDPFDISKLWDEKIFPEIHLGRIVLNENPVNWYSQIEQLSLSPGNLVPGIEPSPVRIQQARIFLYKDAHYARLGANHRFLETNRATEERILQFVTVNVHQSAMVVHIPTITLVLSFTPRPNPMTIENSTPVNATWNSFSWQEQERIIQRMSRSVIKADENLQIRLLRHLKIANRDYCEKLWANLNLRLNPCRET
ncbi:catalase-like [Brevipalpus obovatus]|uniref:catalase-like n=1 Tax=Brevipalpus obovatus TaxID=246614 RepID=UPI003D9F721C